LHKILGIEPQAIVQVVHAPASTSSFRQMSATRDSHAWKDLQDYRDDDDDHKHHTWQGDEEEEGGRYDIGRQPPKKRRKTGKLKDTHTVFIPDTDDDEEDGNRFDEEEGDGNSKQDDARERSRRDDSDRRRSYWLSKGIGFGEGNDDDNYSG
jgi:non-canonical poly(A) RNA polymerase PAPD5/7